MERDWFNLDIDIPYEKFDFNELLNKINNKIGDIVKHVLIRKSSSGNVHVRIELSLNLDVYNIFKLRYYFGDDMNRIIIDMFRLQENETIDRLWDLKFVDNKIGHAGEWVMLQ